MSPSTRIDRIDSLSTSTAVKVPCRAKTTGNITLSGLQTLDTNVVLAAYDRVLVGNQTDPVENGIYEASATTWIRSKDCDGSRDLTDGTQVFVNEGTTYANTYWKFTSTDDPIRIDTSEITVTAIFPGVADVELAAIASLTSAADKLPYFTGSGTAALADFTAAGRAILDDANAAAQRTTLGLGTIATQASSAVAITGGTVTGITDLAVADGGTGSSTAVAARAALGFKGILGHAYAETSALDSTTTVLPIDNTIPQSGEGDEALTVAYERISATSKLVIEAGTTLSASANLNAAIALFQDSGADALAASAQYIGDANVSFNVSLKYEMTSGATGATTFKLRYGGQAGTIYLNGFNTARVFGGVCNTFIKVIEIEV